MHHDQYHDALTIHSSLKAHTYNAMPFAMRACDDIDHDDIRLYLSSVVSPPLLELQYQHDPTYTHLVSYHAHCGKCYMSVYPGTHRVSSPFMRCHRTNMSYYRSCMTINKRTDRHGWIKGDGSTTYLNGTR